MKVLLIIKIKTMMMMMMMMMIMMTKQLGMRKRAHIGFSVESISAHCMKLEL